MKVTVNFGSVRVIVPCGKGDLPVKKLMDLAITRYKKATGKPADSWVTIHNLKLLSDGGILDPDDKLNDVADDREQITAVYDEELSSYLMHNGGDGTSASSIGTESPDIFQNGDILSAPLIKSSYVGSDAEVKEEKIVGGLLPLHVRRGSEPALNRLSPSLLPNIENCKRWSAAVLASDDCLRNLNSEGEEQSEDDIPPGEREDGSGEEKSFSYQQYLNSWNQELNFNKDERREPLGGPVSSANHSSDEADDSDSSSSINQKIEVIKLKKEDGPLGIRIVPAADDSNKKNKGVMIQGIEPGGRIDRDGRFSVGDCITEINGFKISKDSYRNAQEILKDAMKAPELKIHCIKKDLMHNKNKKNKPPTVLPKPNLPSEDHGTAHIKNIFDCDKALAVSTPTKKLLTNVLHKGMPVHSSIRKIGRRILVHLSKGSEGLGFSITSKDANNGPPFFIKNILPAGAAVDDGRLKTGDKLLEVNKIDVSSLTQAEVLNILRNVPYGDVVELVISRLETDLSPSPSLPRELPVEKADEEAVVCAKRKDIFTFKVALNDTGSAGLGVSVKGRTSNTEKGPVDMGIFLKNIFHGGAAHKDGRLHNNDQLMNVNGISLLGMTNGQAMETLRRAMIQGDGPNAVPYAITLTIARRVSSSGGNRSDQGESSGHDRSDSLLSESGDSFYVSNENLTLSNKCNGITPDTSTSDNSGNTVIFMLPAHTNMPNGDRTENDSELLSLSQSIPVSFSQNGLVNGESERLFGENTFEEQKSSVAAIAKHSSSDLIDLNETVTLGACEQDFELTDSFQENMSLGNHKKSFSNPVDMDLYRPVLNGHDTLDDLRNCDSPPPASRGIAKRKRYLMERNDNFKRSGMGRQSMPEKILWSYQRHQYSPNESPNESNCYFTPQNVRTSHLPNTCCDNTPIREMPVDVGPYEYSVHLEQMDRTKGSCDSPDCPYHAVPTTGRESGGSNESNDPVGPSLGLLKSSSLESLQTMLREKQKLNMSASNGNTSRGCNESFRAAVDKSFEAVDQNENSTVDKDKVPQATNGNRHTRSKTVETMEKKENKSHKKKGIFKGLGSVFKFGKSSKKSNKETTATSCKEPVPSQLISAPLQNGVLAEQERLNRLHQEQLEYQRLHLQTNRSSRNSFTFPRNRNASFQNHSTNPHSPQNRVDRMYALRTEHQKKHKQRNGFYPQEDQEEMYEQQIKEAVDPPMVNRPLPPIPHQEPVSEKENCAELSPKSKTLEIYKEMSKPGSRKGFVDPDRYSHYMNFQEIQQHLQQFRHHQNLFFNDSSEVQSPYLLTNSHMVSPHKRYYRHTVSSPRSRPVSEFFDFRNEEQSSSTKRTSESGSLPRKMFQNGRHRPPIPAAFLTQQSQNGVAGNRRIPNNLYGQTSGLEEMYKHKSSGSKV
ncbi:partitioning defective 3 homolog isoform X2 [Parasteatoda tepidariorum]|uniref:partitioning defective 3 homolog isoform X2 n=1 Tax=Parasteatoda tepidariorum TaxID=114398 RepID=UPI001C724008|nr:partitioning defective 3 homolog isoform X2 [Parasteatoda tepidariorum]